MATREDVRRVMRSLRMLAADPERTAYQSMVRRAIRIVEHVGPEVVGGTPRDLGRAERDLRGLDKWLRDHKPPRGVAGALYGASALAHGILSALGPAEYRAIRDAHSPLPSLRTPDPQLGRRVVVEAPRPT